MRPVTPAEQRTYRQIMGQTVADMLATHDIPYSTYVRAETTTPPAYDLAADTRADTMALIGHAREVITKASKHRHGLRLYLFESETELRCALPHWPDRWNVHAYHAWVRICVILGAARDKPIDVKVTWYGPRGDNLHHSSRWTAALRHEALARVLGEDFPDSLDGICGDE